MNRARVRLARRLATVEAFREARVAQCLAEAKREHARAREAVEEAGRALVWIERRRGAELDGGRFDVAICEWLDQARLLAAGALAAREHLAERASGEEENQVGKWVTARARREGTAHRAEAMHDAHVADVEARSADRALETWLASSRGML